MFTQQQNNRKTNNFVALIANDAKRTRHSFNLVTGHAVSAFEKIEFLFVLKNRICNALSLSLIFYL